MNKLFLLLIIGLVGCTSGYFSGVYHKITTTEYPNGITKTEDLLVKGKALLPENLKSSEGFTVGENGVGTGALETHEIDWASKELWIFYIFSGVLLIGAVLCVWKAQYVLGGLLGVASLLAGCAPSILPIVGTFLAYLFVGLILVGVCYFIGKYAFKIDLFKRNKPGIQKLRKAGREKEATAIERAIDSNINKEWEDKNG